MIDRTGFGPLSSLQIRAQGKGGVSNNQADVGGTGVGTFIFAVGELEKKAHQKTQLLTYKLASKAE
jgi:hypothetical protein